ncbi:MAG: benzoate/H(+) symporter BenE family transporter [Proteobacteria bacterium]|nr:benzoate/H(+) symporter BenE family transporter [Pseudomonadota bacterium]
MDINSKHPEKKSGSLTAWVAGFLAVLISYAGPLVIYIQAAQAGNISSAELTSWIWAISIGAGVSGLLLSWWLKLPIITAWSAPGTALLLSLFPSITMPEVVGAYLVAAVAVIIIGVSGWFERIVNFIPRGIAAGMMVGILFQFGVQAFRASMELPVAVFAMLAAYLLARRLLPRYAVVLTLAVGVAWAALDGQMRWSAVHFALATPVFTAPSFSLSALMSLALPLFIVTMASQNLPGVAVMRATGYQLPVSRLISMIGLATLVLAPFGGFALNFSAITAAICMGPEAHPDPARRYTAAASCGLLYIAVGIFGAVVTGLLTAFPPELVVAIAGLALLGAIGGGLASALADEGHREPALITFLVTLSGVSLAGIGSAFWGVVAGSAALFVQQYGRRRAHR